MDLVLQTLDPDQHDLSALAALIYAADPEFNRLVFGDKEQGKSLIERLLKLDNQYFSPRNLRLVIQKKRVAGVVVGFPVKEKKQLDMDSGKCFTRVFGLWSTVKNMGTLMKMDRIVSKHMDPQGYFIHTLSVHAHFRRQGIGRFLLEEVARDYPTCYVDVNINRPEALAFYQSLGFTVESKQLMHHRHKEMGLYNLKRG